jgi:hypothetical protein
MRRQAPTAIINGGMKVTAKKRSDQQSKKSFNPAPLYEGNRSMAKTIAMNDAIAIRVVRNRFEMGGVGCMIITSARPHRY